MIKKKTKKKRKEREKDKEGARYCKAQPKQTLFTIGDCFCIVLCFFYWAQQKADSLQKGIQSTTKEKENNNLTTKKRAFFLDCFRLKNTASRARFKAKVCVCVGGD